MKSIALYSTLLFSLVSACDSAPPKDKAAKNASGTTTVSETQTSTSNANSNSNRSGSAAAGAQTKGGCYVKDEQYQHESCFDYVNTQAASDALKQGCQNGGGEFRAEGCPSANRVGRCLIAQSEYASAEMNFYAPEVDAAQAEQACKYMHGTFRN